MSNLSQYTRQLDMRVLSQTFRDAIEIAKVMSVPHLWIDALCTIQDSEQDKFEEIRVMERIYRESVVTIVAASSGEAKHGFLQRRPPLQDSYAIPFRIAGGHFGSMSIHELDGITYDESLEPINKRAWTLQEQFIPHRFLIYAFHTLQWRYNAGVQNLGRSSHYAAYSDDLKSCETLLTLRDELQNGKTNYQGGLES
jgi:Heterokaryon incompatibility protein (HET)